MQIFIPKIAAWLALIGISAILAGNAEGAMLYLEDFSAGANGWVERDAGEMTVSYDAGNQWMVGDFGTSFLPQVDAFRIASGADFIGDYVTPGLTQIRFKAFSDDVLPSDMFINLIDGANTFSYQFSSVNNLNSWQTFTVNLAWSFGWNGVSQAAFNTALASIDAVEIQFARNGSGAQSYFLDNVETLDTDIGGGGPGGGGGGLAGVPEPTTFGLGLAAAVLILVFNQSSSQERRG